MSIVEDSYASDGCKYLTTSINVSQYFLLQLDWGNLSWVPTSMLNARLNRQCWSSWVKSSINLCQNRLVTYNILMQQQNLNWKSIYLGISTWMLNLDMPNSNNMIIWTPMFELYVIGFRSKNGHQKKVFWREVGLHAQNMLTTLSSIVNIIGRGGGERLYDHLMNKYKLQRLWGKWLHARGSVNHLALIMCSISYEMWVPREERT